MAEATGTTTDGNEKRQHPPHWAAWLATLMGTTQPASSGGNEVRSPEHLPFLQVDRGRNISIPIPMPPSLHPPPSPPPAPGKQEVNEQLTALIKTALTNIPGITILPGVMRRRHRGGTTLAPLLQATTHGITTTRIVRTRGMGKSSPPPAPSRLLRATSHKDVLQLWGAQPRAAKLPA